MNKEDLIKRLEFIEEQTSVTDYSELQSKRIEDSIIARNRMEIELNELLKKTGDENNYVLDTKKLTDTTERILTDQILSGSSELARNKADITKYDGQIEDINKIIQDGNELMEIGKNEINEMQAKIDSGNYTKTLTAKFKKDIDDTHLAISDIENMCNDWITKQESIKSLRANLEKSSETLTEVIKNNKTSLEDSHNQVSSNSYLNETVYQNDLARIEELKGNLSLMAIENVKQYRFSTNVGSLISKINDDKLNDNEINEELTNFKNNFVLFSDIDVANRDSIIKENKVTQEFFTKEISRLQEKLALENSYIISTFNKEVRQEEITKTRVRIESNKARLAELEYQKSTIENEINNRTSDIIGIDSAMEAWGRNSLAMGGTADQRIQNAFVKQLVELQKQKTSANKRLEEITSKLDEIEIQTKSINQSIKKDEKSLKEKEQKPIIDMAMKIADESKLEKYNELLDSYKKEEEFLSFNIVQELDSIISDFGKDKDITESGPTVVVGTETKEEPMVNGVLADFEQFNKETDEILLSAKAMLNDEIPKSVKPTEETNKKPTKIAFWTKAKNKVVDKLREKGFLVKVIAGILIIATGLGLLRGCKKENSVEIIADDTSISNSIDKDLYLDQKYENANLYINGNPIEKEAEVEEESKGETIKNPNNGNYNPPKVEKPVSEPVEKPIASPEGGNSSDILEDDKLDLPDDLPEYTGPADNKPNPPVYPPVTPPVEPPVTPPVEPPVEPTPDPEDEISYNIYDGDVFYTYNPETGQVEVKSNNDSLTSDQAATDFENQTGLNSTGNSEEYKDITGTTSNPDGSMDVTTSNPTDSNETLVDIIQDGYTNEEISDMQQDNDLALAEWMAENEMGGNTR